MRGPRRAARRWQRVSRQPRLGSSGRRTLAVSFDGRGRPFVSDNGNRIIDCAVKPIESPAALEARLRAIPGVVDTGLFLGTAHTVLVADGDAIRELRRRATP